MIYTSPCPSNSLLYFPYLLKLFIIVLFLGITGLYSQTNSNFQTNYVLILTNQLPKESKSNVNDLLDEALRDYPNIRGIKFLEPNPALLDFPAKKLINDIDFYISFMGSLSIREHTANNSLLKSAIDTKKEQLNTTSTSSTNNYVDYKESSAKGFGLGLSIEVFLFNYFGLGFNYNRMNYFHTEYQIIKDNPSASDYYDNIIGYQLSGYGNAYHFSLLARVPFSPRIDQNIFLILGLGYSLYSATLDLNYTESKTGINQNESFTSDAHGVNGVFQITTKLDWFQFSLGTLWIFGEFSEFDKTSTIIPDLPKKIDISSFTPLIYLKFGVNF